MRKLIILCLILWITTGCTLPTPVPRQSSPPDSASPLSATPVPPEMTALIQAVVTRSPAQVYGAYPSPDNRWRAEVIVHPCVAVGEAQNAYERLHLIPAQGTKPQLVDQQVQSCGGLGAYGLAGLFWSPASRYFYYTDAREGVPDGCGFWARPIRRVDTTTLQTQLLGNGTRSPDGTKIATWQGNEFALWAVDGDLLASQPLLMRNAQLGSYAWSPDGQALVYIQIASSCPPIGPATLIKVDLATQQQSTLFTDDQAFWSVARWEEPTHLNLLDEKQQAWRFDLATQQITRE